MKDRARLEAWEIALKDAASHPFLGGGPSTYEIAFRRHRTEVSIAAIGQNIQDHAHNSLLNGLATTGALGVLTALWVLKSLKPTPPVLAALVAFGVSAAVNPVSIEVWCLMAILASTAGKKTNWIPLCIGLIGLCCWGVYLQAEHSPVKERVEIVPCENVYLTQYANEVPRMIAESRTRESLVDVLRKAHGVAQRAVKCRPNNSEVRLAAGTIYGYAAQLGVPTMRDLSNQEYAAARRFDPKNNQIGPSYLDTSKK